MKFSEWVNIKNKLNLTKFWVHNRVLPQTGPPKSLALLLPPKITDPIPTIEILFNNNPVSVNKSVKYLGIAIDKKLNFAERIIKLSCKISRSVGILAKLWNILPFTSCRKW